MLSLTYFELGVGEVLAPPLDPRPGACRGDRDLNLDGPRSPSSLAQVRPDDIERYRGRWVALRRSDEVVLADAASLEDLQRSLDASVHPQVLIRRIPALDDPVFVGLG